MTTYTDAVIVGGGQAGLAVSYYLRKEARDHVVLEQAEKPAEVWRNHRWDSFTSTRPTGNLDCQAPIIPGPTRTASCPARESSTISKPMPSGFACPSGIASG